MKSFKIGLLTLSLVSMGLSACAAGSPQSSSHSNRNIASGAQSKAHAGTNQNSVSYAQLQRMAQSGDADAQYALGYRYYYGIGVKQNTESSLSWMTQAASQGQKQALQALRLIKQANAAQSTHQTAQSTQASQNQTAKTASASSQNTQYSKPSYNFLTRRSHAKGAQPASHGSQQIAKATIPGFTLQLMGTHDKQSLIDFIMSNNLQDKATYYRRSYDGQDWYVLVSGRYSSQQEALDAIDRLPETLKSMNPWVKPLGLVKQEMQS